MKIKLRTIYYRLLIFFANLLIDKPIEFFCPLVHDPLSFLRAAGVSIGHNVRIGFGLRVHNFSSEKLIIGNNVHIGKNVFLDTSETIIIESQSTISMQVTLLTHIDLGDSSLKQFYPAMKSSLLIGANTYIGANTTVINKVTSIGPCVVIGAHSLVNKNLEPDKLYMGCPVNEVKTL